MTLSITTINGETQICGNILNVIFTLSAGICSAEKTGKLIHLYGTLRALKIRNLVQTNDCAANKQHSVWWDVPAQIMENAATRCNEG